MKILVTGGAGFIGSHVAEYYARRGDDVVVFDNLSRARLLKQADTNARHNWNYLGQFKNVKRVLGDICDLKALLPHCRKADTIFHIAGQTAVTTSVTHPEPDFATNALGTFNVLEAIRRSGEQKNVVFTSTNKVYGDNVNLLAIREQKTRYGLTAKYKSGVPESLSVDHCKHTPYGCSKLTADLYMQDWGKLYGHRVGVFRMSCIYGTRQFGFEDQGWLAWFTIAALKQRPVTIYGDGKQMRDVLFVTDLVQAFDRFVKSKHEGGVFNTGGGSGNTLSLLELVDKLADRFGRRLEMSFSDWRPSDQKVFVSDISKLQRELKWSPKVTPDQGVDHLVAWVKANSKLW
jgi:CDP-paratose 2-epimerase